MFLTRKFNYFLEKFIKEHIFFLKIIVFSNPPIKPQFLAPNFKLLTKKNLLSAVCYLLTFLLSLRQYG